MKALRYTTWLTLPLVAFIWAGVANAATVIPGIAVGGGGTSYTTEVVPTVGGKIKYYIPLNGADEVIPGNYNGVYGVAGTSPCPGGAGTCSDWGYGSGYAGADALQLFDTWASAVPVAVTCAMVSGASGATSPGA